VKLNPELAAACEAAKSEVIAASRYLGRRQYHVALAGNVSARVSEDLLVCTRHGADKEALVEDDLVMCDMSGRKLDGAGEATSELNMHREAYRLRPDVRMVIHSHPPAATAFAATGTPLDQLQLPEMIVLLGPVCLVPYATPGSEQLARNLSLLLKDHDAFLLENHGALTLGRSARQAALRMDLLEQNARVTLMTRQLGRPFALNPADFDTLLSFRPQMADWGGEPLSTRESESSAG
jgi:L-fuculose-phosphate aldolase